MKTARRVLVSTTVLLAGSSALALQPPTLPSNTPYSVARRVLIATGYQPVSVQRPRCATGREEICRAYAETEACRADAQARCIFLWRREAALIEVHTRGENDIVVDRLRCRTGCE